MPLEFQIDINEFEEFKLLSSKVQKIEDTMLELTNEINRRLIILESNTASKYQDRLSSKKDNNRSKTFIGILSNEGGVIGFINRETMYEVPLEEAVLGVQRTRLQPQNKVLDKQKYVSRFLRDVENMTDSETDIYYGVTTDELLQLLNKCGGNKIKQTNVFKINKSGEDGFKEIENLVNKNNVLKLQ